MPRRSHRPRELEDLGAGGTGDVAGGVVRAGIDDDDFLDEVGDGTEARGETDGLVPDNHAEGDSGHGESLLQWGGGTVRNCTGRRREFTDGGRIGRVTS